MKYPKTIEAIVVRRDFGSDVAYWQLARIKAAVLAGYRAGRRAANKKHKQAAAKSA